MKNSRPKAALSNLLLVQVDACDAGSFSWFVEDVWYIYLINIY